MLLPSASSASVSILLGSASLLASPASASAQAATKPGTAAAETTVSRADIETGLLDGLAWLQRQQETEGNWSMVKSVKLCPTSFDQKLDARADYDVGLTGLAVLGYSRAQRARGGRTSLDEHAALEKGVAWLVAKQKPDGSINDTHPFMYAQAIAACALVSAYEGSHDPKVRDAAQKLVDFVQAAQRPSPTGKGLWGWRYSPRQEIEKANGDGVPNKELFDSDISVTAWCVEALRAARNAGLKVDDASFEGAEAFAKFTTTDTGAVGYLDPKTAGATVQGKNDHFAYHATVMNALGTLVRLDTGEQPSDEIIGKSMKGLLADLPAVSADHLTVDYYFWHHGVAALRRTNSPGGDAWTNTAVSHLLLLQDKSQNDCARGAWVVGDRWSYAGGALYTTGINVLTLEDALGWK
jgi:hypothetical protein